MFAFIARSLFGRSDVKAPKATPARPQRPARLELETLGERVSPARIDLLAACYAVGYSSLGGTSRLQSRQLSSYASQDLTRVTSAGYSRAVTGLTFENWSSTSKRVQLRSDAVAQNSYREAIAQAYTSDRTNGYLAWIPVRVAATSAGEVGRMTPVTISASYSGYRSNANASNFVQVSYVVPGQPQVNLILGSNIGSASNSRVVNVAAGSTFYVHVHTYSRAYNPNLSGVGSAASGAATLNISVPGW